MKRRCDRNNPCSNCAQRQLECAYQRGGPENTNTSALEDRSSSVQVDDTGSSIPAEQITMCGSSVQFTYVLILTDIF